MNIKKTVTDVSHIINQAKLTTEPIRTEVIYTLTGKQDYLESDKYPCVKMDSDIAADSPKAFAMKITIGKRTKYYAKHGRHGRL